MFDIKIWCFSFFLARICRLPLNHEFKKNGSYCSIWEKLISITAFENMFQLFEFILNYWLLHRTRNVIVHLFSLFFWLVWFVYSPFVFVVSNCLLCKYLGRKETDFQCHCCWQNICTHFVKQILLPLRKSHPHITTFLSPILGGGCLN